MALPTSSISCCISKHLTRKFSKRKALAFHLDRCCHLAICLRLILFHCQPKWSTFILKVRLFTNYNKFKKIFSVRNGLAYCGFVKKSFVASTIENPNYFGWIVKIYFPLKCNHDKMINLFFFFFKFDIFYDLKTFCSMKIGFYKYLA